MKKKQTQQTRERRAFAATELRATIDGDQRVLQGHAIVFNSPSQDMGGWVEVCDPGMLARTLRDSPDILALRDHAPSALLGRTTAGTLGLRVDPKGLEFRIAVPDTEVGRDTYENVRLGNLTGVSFGFKSQSDQWSKAADGTVVRRLLDVDLFELSPTSFAAYPAAGVSLRNCPPEIRSLIDVGGLFDGDDDGDEDEETDSLGVDAFEPYGVDEADFMRSARLALALRRIRGR